jgi:flagellar basal-body rod modification protein FlgD
MGKNEFIKLLVAQMTHQDPLNPLDGQQMAAQLAQFSSVEQLMNIGEKLDAQAASNSAALQVANNSAAMSVLGRNITVETDQIVVGPNGTESVSVDVPSMGGRLTARILSPSGTVLRTVPLGFASGGERTIELDDAMEGLQPGTYRIEVGCESDGESLQLAPRTTVRADGVRFGPDGTVVTSGTLTFPIGAIISISTAN